MLNRFYKKKNVLKILFNIYNFGLFKSWRLITIFFLLIKCKWNYLSIFWNWKLNLNEIIKKKLFKTHGRTIEVLDLFGN